MLTSSITGKFLDSVLTRILPTPVGANTNVATGVAVLVCTADWGPLNTVTAVGSFDDFVAAFGSYAKPADDETSGYQKAWGYFKGGKKRRIAGGGADLRVIRIAGAPKAKSTHTILDNAGSPGTVGTLTGLYYGAYGDGIQYVTEDGNNHLAAPAAPACTPSNVGGTLTTQAEASVIITRINNRGETTGSAATAVAVTGPTGSVDVTLPNEAGVTYGVYYGDTAGTEKLVTNAAAGASYTIDAEPAVDAATPPTTNTAATSFHLTIVPPDNSAPEVFKDLTPATAEAAINVGTAAAPASKWVTYAAGASTLLPTPTTAYLAGGDSGLTVTDNDYIGTAGVSPTGLQLAATVADANFIGCGTTSTAIKAEIKSICDANFVQTVTGPNDNTVTVAAAKAEIIATNDWAVAYCYGYQNWLNPVSGLTQSVLPDFSIIGALCNGDYWVNLTQCQLNGYLGLTNALSEVDANILAQAGGIPITAGSVCRKGSNTSQDTSINQIEDFRIPVYIARSLDLTVAPLLGEPQDYDPNTGESDFFTNLKEACENVLRSQPKEAIQPNWSVVAAYDQTLAQQNKARVQAIATQTGKANQILVDLSEGRTVIVPSTAA